MSTRYSTTNPLDRIFLGIANLVIVCAGAVVLYHCVVRSIDPPPYEATTVAISSHEERASAMTVANSSASGACADCASVSIVR